MKRMEEPPTDEYYDLLRKEMGHRHPTACTFLDKSILFGLSFRVGKAEVGVAEASSWATQLGGAGVRRTQNGVKP